MTSEIDAGLNMVIGGMVKILLVVITLLSLIIARQVSLMDKVVSVEVGGNIKLISWIFLLISLVITGIVMLG